jgi:aspartate kinase
MGTLPLRWVKRRRARSMALIVQKYGGTSVGTAERIKNVARRVARWKSMGHQLVVVPSAMSGETNRLIALAKEISPNPDPRELDVVASTGEQVTIGLLSMALLELGIKAKSYTGAQVKILTDSAHTKARILNIENANLRADLDAGCVVVVAGFQGVDEFHNITTLGRGGSDTSAVAIAAAMNAEECQIYTDVDGVYTADPRIVPTARKRSQVSYEEMLELAASGARVLALRSVEYARNHGVKLHVRSSFKPDEGTWVLREDDMLEQAIISGIAHDTSEARVTMHKVPDQPGVAARMFEPLAEAGINIGEIFQNTSTEGLADISFTLPENDLQRAEPILDALSREIGAQGFDGNRDIAKVTVVGAGMKSNPGVAAAIFSALADAGINIEMISTSSIRVSCVVPAGEASRAVNVIHERLRLAEEVLYDGDPAAA